MTRTALTKLAILVILAFIICLPEFFTFYKDSSVSLRCMQHELREHGKNDQEAKDVWKNKTCHEQWERFSAQADQSNMTETGTHCFVCETKASMAEFDNNNSSSAQNVYIEVWLSLQFTNTGSVNFTLSGRYNRSSMQLHLNDQEDEEDERKDDEGPKEVFLYCPPFLDTSNHSHCHLWLSNQTLVTARGRLPWKQTTKDDWRCVFRVVWLTLLCVLLLIVITVLGQIISGKKCCSDKAKIYPFKYTIQEQHVISKERYLELNTPKVLNLDAQVPHLWSELYTIEEMETPDATKTEMFFNENGCNANLHHRSAPSSSIRRIDLMTATTKGPS